MDKNILIEELNNSNTRDEIYDLAQTQVTNLEGQINTLEMRKKVCLNAIELVQQKYDRDRAKYDEKVISNAEFSIIDQEHQKKINEFHLNKISIEIEINAKKGLKQRLNCLSWLLKIPYNQDEIRVVNRGTGKEAIITKRDIYNKYFEVIINTEESRLKDYLNSLRLQISTQKIVDYSDYVKSHFHSDDLSISDKVAITKESLRTVMAYKEQVNGNYTNFIDYKGLTIGDFMDDSSEFLFERLCLNDSDKKEKQAM